MQPLGGRGRRKRGLHSQVLVVVEMPPKKKMKKKKALRFKLCSLLLTVQQSSSLPLPPTPPPSAAGEGKNCNAALAKVMNLKENFAAENSLSTSSANVATMTTTTTTTATNQKSLKQCAQKSLGKKRETATPRSPLRQLPLPSSPPV